MTEARQIHRDDAVAPRELGEQREPRRRGVPAAVQEDHRRAAAALQVAERRAQRGAAVHRERGRARGELRKDRALDRAKAETTAWTFVTGGVP